MSIIFEIMNNNPQELLKGLKKKLFYASIESLEHSSTYESLFKEIQADYFREKCDVCYLFTFSSASITSKTQGAVFSRLLFAYAQLYLEKGDSTRCLGVISQFITHSSRCDRLNKERNDIVEKAFDDFYSFLKVFPRNISTVLSRISFEAVSNSKPIVNFFFLFIQCLSTVQLSDIVAIEQFISFYIINEKDIRKSLLNDIKRIETCVKLLTKLADSIFNLITFKQCSSQEVNHLFHLAIQILSIVISSFTEDDENEDNPHNVLPKKMLFDIVIVNLTKISILFSKRTVKDFNGIDSLNAFIARGIHHIEKYLEKESGTKTLKTYSTILGKAENIFANLDSIDNRNKYSMKIVEMYKKHKYSSVDLLRVKLNLFRSFIGELFISEAGNDTFNYESFQSHIDELIVLINSTHLYDDNEREYFTGMITQLIKWIESAIFNEVRKATQAEKLALTADYLYTSFTSILPKQKGLLSKEFGLFVDLLYVISVERTEREEKEDKAKRRVNMLKLFYSLKDINEVKKINYYSQAISFFLCLNYRFEVIKEKMSHLANDSSDIKFLLGFYSHVLYFINKTASIKENEGALLLFLFESMTIVIGVIDAKCTIFTYKEIKESFENDLLSLFYSLIKSEFNRRLNHIDLYSKNEQVDDCVFIQYLNELFKSIQVLIKLNERVGSMLKALKDRNQVLSFNTEVNCNSHLDSLINISIRLYSFSKPYNLLILQNPQVLDSSFADSNALLYVKLMLSSLIKNGAGLKQRNSIDFRYQFNNEISDILSKLEIVTANDEEEAKKSKSKQENKKKYLIYKNVHTFIDIKLNEALLDDSLSHQLVNETKTKTDFIINQIIIKSLMERELFLGLNYNDLQCNDIINQLISKNINYITQVIHKDDMNHQDRVKPYRTLYNTLLVLKSIVSNQVDLIDYSFIQELINELPAFNQNATLKTNIDQVIIIKVLSIFYQKYYLILPLDVKEAITAFVTRAKSSLSSERLSRNFSFFEYVVYLELSFALSIHHSASTLKEMINEGKELLEDLVSMYKLQLTPRAKNIIENVEVLKARVSLAFICNYRYVENSFLALLWFIDYQFFVADTVAKIAQLTQLLLRQMNGYGFCNIALQLYSLIDKISVLSYNKQFITFMLEMLIKITRNLKRSSMSNLIPEELGLDSFGDFVSIISDIFQRYLRLKYNIDIRINSDQYKQLEELERDVAEIAIKEGIRDRTIDKFFHSNATIREMAHCDSDIKRITSMLKHNLINDDKDENSPKRNKELFEQIYFTTDLNSDEDVLQFYLKEINNSQFKHQIKLIPYVYPHILHEKILTEEAIENILSVFSKCFQSTHQLISTEDYKRIKHIKKVITELIHFSTEHRGDTTSSGLIEKLIGFYIKHLLNFKYRLYSNQYPYTKEDHPEEKGLPANCLSLFRIKKSLFFCLQYKMKLYYNVVQLNTKQMKNIFSTLEANLHKTNTTSKTIKSTLISKLEVNLDCCFQQLQSALISASIKEGLMLILTENASFNNYLDRKLAKYPMIAQTKEELIKGLFAHEQSFPKSNSKRAISISDYISKLRKKLFGARETKMSLYDQSQGVFYYIPSGELSRLPIENLPLLFKLPITRIFNYSILSDPQHSPIEHITLSPSEIFCLLNPSQDLIDSEKVISPIIRKNCIENIIGKPASHEEMVERIRDKKMFIYCGHGDGTKYLNTSYIKNNTINFISLLFGCSSACVTDYLDKDTQPFGLPHFYQMNHCPFYLGFLWAITSKDIDRFLVNLLENLFERKTISLIDVILMFKAKISNKNLNAASLVIYSDKDTCITLNN